MVGSSAGPTVRPSLRRLLAVADDDTDSDDLRLRKHIGVAAGYLTIVAPLALPLIAQGHPVAVVMAVSLSVFIVANLVVLARTHRFERYVVALLCAGTVFVPTVTWLGGGLTLSSAGLIWGFLMPAYALLALGPTRATRWFFVFVGVVGAALVLELIRSQPLGPEPREALLAGAVFNTIAPMTIVFVLLRYSDRRRRDAETRSEALLTNAIPASIARRLRQGEEHIADAYPETTVLFADVVGFTPWARGTDPVLVATVLDRLFSRFDEIVTAAGAEKIKTIGDSYMVVTGAPEPRSDHGRVAMAVALEMLGAAEAWRTAEGLTLEIRIGLASGSVAGGVIGRHRIFFDLWGDTVNTAARMESTGDPGHIQLSESTRALLDDEARYVSRQVEVKGMGTMTTYLVGRPNAGG